MNIRSLTRGDGVVIGAAVLLFIASFLDFYDCSGQFCNDSDLPSAWSSNYFPVLPAIFLAGLIAAGLIVANRFLPEGRKPAGLGFDQWGTALGVFAAWSALWTFFGALSHDNASPGTGQILGLFAVLALAAGTVLGAQVPALKAPLLPEPRPQAASPYGGSGPASGYGYPGQQGAASSPYGVHPGQPGPHGQHGHPGQQQYGGQPGPAASQAGQPGPAPAADFAPFWFAVPVNRPLYAEDGSPTPVAELAPGTWYLAVDQRGQALVAQTQDGRRGVLQDTSGIQRG